MDVDEDVSHDGQLMNILEQTQSIPNFLRIVFGFLYRKTDLFLSYDEATGMGYPPGQCERLVFDQMVYFSNKKKSRSGYDMACNENTVYEEVIETEIESTNDSTSNDLSTDQNKDSIFHFSNDSSGTISNTPISVSSMETEPEGSSSVSTVQSQTEGSSKVDVTKRTPRNCFNGADCGLYCWSQTFTEIELEFPLEEDVKKATDITVNTLTDTIHIFIKNDHKLNGLLAYKIKPDETVWTLTPGKYIQVQMEKVTEEWWDRFLATEPKIDLRTIDTTRPFSDMSQEEQMHINKAVMNDFLKSRGLGTTDQLKNANVLREAWDLEGSPFKGKPFDPSIFNN